MSALAAGDQFSLDRTKPGVYQIQVYLMRNAARREEALPLPADGRIDAGRCAGSRSQYQASNLPARGGEDVWRAAGARLRWPRRCIVRGGLEIDGTADKQPEGVKKLRCIFDGGGGRFKRIMAMTPDGE
ncbi:MAG: hypothetical protein MZV49_08120 [Rhodopseudomonas palustris]|nr:hypothetical protein [Rhodopseudomonas palustris]